MAPGRSDIMRHIIAPLSMPGVRVAIFINLLGSLRAFDTIYVLTGGGPVRSTETIGFFMYPRELHPVQARLRRGRDRGAADCGADRLHSRHHPTHEEHTMIGKPPRWIPIVVTVISIIWAAPLLGIVITSIRPQSDTILGWWRLDHVQLTLEAWRDVWARYPLANSFWVTVQLAGIATIGSMLFTPAAAYAFQFLRFPFRRTLLVIIINAFVLPQQVVVIPLFTLWRQMGLIDNIASVLIPYVGL